MKKQAMRAALSMLIVLALLCPAALALDSGGSLWGKKVTPEWVSLPAEAYDANMVAPRIAGISGDGGKVLIVGMNVAPYLWDIDKGVKIPLTLGNQASEEQFTLFCDASLAKLDEKQRTYLTSKYTQNGVLDRFAMASDETLRMIRYTSVSGYDDRYMWVFNPLFQEALVDFQTGEMYLAPEGSLTLPVVDGRTVVHSPDGIRIMDLQSGDIESYPSYGDAWNVAFGCFLPDGSVAAVLRGMPPSPRGAKECVLSIRRRDGVEERYSLGAIEFPREPRTILYTPDGSFLCLFASSYLQMMKPFLVDRRTGAVSLLVRENMNFRALPLSECLDENGVAQPPEAMSREVFIPLSAMRDGTLMILDMMMSDLSLLRPEDMATHMLLDTQKLDGSDYNSIRQAVIVAAPPLSGNGFDVFAARGQEGYIRLTEGAFSLSDLFGGLFQ